jgi:hypothetical protein
MSMLGSGFGGVVLTSVMELATWRSKILPADTPPSSPRSLLPNLSTRDLASEEFRPSSGLHFVSWTTWVKERAWAGLESGSLDWPDLWPSSDGCFPPMSNAVSFGC